MYAHWFCVLGSVGMPSLGRRCADRPDDRCQFVEDAADLACKLEGAGFGGMLYTETQVPWMQIAAARWRRRACSSQPASPWRFQPDALCCDGVRDHRQHRGRFRLGLGSQVKAHVERRYSADFDRPAARMRDYVEAVKAARRAFNREERPTTMASSTR